MKKDQVKIYTFDKLFVGQTDFFEEKITDDLIESFANLSGDHNPLHIDSSYADKTEFKKPIAHGFIGGMFFSRLVGMYLPGAYSLYLTQNLRFRSPLHAGNIVRVVGKITQKIEALKVVKMYLQVESVGVIVIEGEALIKVLL